MKGSNKRLNRRKASKVTLKNHQKSSHPSIQDEIKEVSDSVTAVRPEDINLHQHY